MQVELTDFEWMSLIDKDRDGLPACCANISALRDVIISIARNGGYIGAFDAPDFLRKYQWVKDGHDMSNLPLVEKMYKMVLEADNGKVILGPCAELSPEEDEGANTE